jgi:hypothetical protein
MLLSVHDQVFRVREAFPKNRGIFPVRDDAVVL